MSRETFTKAMVEALEDSAAVGAQVGDRIYYSLPPKNATKPYVVYDVDVDDEPESMQTGVANDLGLMVFGVRFQFIGTTPETVLDASQAVHDLLHNFSGTLGTVNTAYVQVMRRESSTKGAAVPIDGSDTKVHWVDDDYVVIHR